MIVSRIRAGVASRVAPLAALGVAGAAFAYVGAVDPHQPGHYPVCPVLRYGGVFCPGCGGLRSVHALVHGDLVGALGANAVVVGAVVILAVAWAVWCVRPVRGFSLPMEYVWAAGVMVLVFHCRAKSVPRDGADALGKCPVCGTKVNRMRDLRRWPDTISRD